MLGATVWCHVDRPLLKIQLLAVHVGTSLQISSGCTDSKIPTIADAWSVMVGVQYEYFNTAFTVSGSVLVRSARLLRKRGN